MLALLEELREDEDDGGQDGIEVDLGDDIVFFVDNAGLHQARSKGSGRLLEVVEQRRAALPAQAQLLEAFQEVIQPVRQDALHALGLLHGRIGMRALLVMKERPAAEHAEDEQEGGAGQGRDVDRRGNEHHRAVQGGRQRPSSLGDGVRLLREPIIDLRRADPPALAIPDSSADPMIFFSIWAAATSS